MIPEPPTNVRVQLPGGEIVPCELAYEGITDGVHTWVAVTPVVATPGPGVHLLCDVLPAKTSIAIQFTPRKDI